MSLKKFSSHDQVVVTRGMYESDITIKMIHFLVLLRWLEGTSRYLLKLISLCDFNPVRVLWSFVHPKPLLQPKPHALFPCRPRLLRALALAIAVAVAVAVAVAHTLAVAIAVVYRPTLASGRQRTSPHSFAGSLPVRGAASRPCPRRRRRPHPRSLVVDRPTQTICRQRTSPHSATGIACPLGCPSRHSRRLCSLLPQRIPLRSRRLLAAACTRFISTASRVWSSSHRFESASPHLLVVDMLVFNR